MEEIRKLDPTYTDWVPKTATQAIRLFYKKKELEQIQWDDLDITFRQLARGLDQTQFNIFVQWITNPTCVQAGSEPDCFPKNGYVERENSTHMSTPLEQEDEKCPL